MPRGTLLTLPPLHLNSCITVSLLTPAHPNPHPSESNPIQLHPTLPLRVLYTAPQDACRRGIQHDRTQKAAHERGERYRRRLRLERKPGRFGTHSAHPFLRRLAPVLLLVTAQLSLLRCSSDQLAFGAHHVHSSATGSWR